MKQNQDYLLLCISQEGTYQARPSSLYNLADQEERESRRLSSCARKLVLQHRAASHTHVAFTQPQARCHLGVELVSQGDFTRVAFPWGSPAVISKIIILSVFPEFIIF